MNIEEIIKNTEKELQKEIEQLMNKYNIDTIHEMFESMEYNIGG